VISYSRKLVLRSRPHAEEHRGASEHRRFHRLGALRCASKHEGHAVAVLILRDARTRIRLRGSACACARLRMRTAELAARRRTVSVIPSSRCQTAHLLPAAHVCARGFAPLLHSPRIEGWAERRETFGCSGTRGIRHSASKTRVNALMTRRTRRLRGALRPMTRDARLSALHRGDFGPRGRASVSLGARRPTTAGSCLRTRAASSSQPGRSAWRAGVPGLPGRAVTSRLPQDATPRSAFRIVSRTRPQ
jgi:hypothetical protein